ncbi:hypothetical protein BGX26_008126, partial [Mortierella sp. AD094]
NDLDAPLKIIHQTIERVPEKLALVEFEQSTLGQDTDFVSHETDEDRRYEEDETAKGIDELIEINTSYKNQRSHRSRELTEMRLKYVKP